MVSTIPISSAVRLGKSHPHTNFALSASEMMNDMKISVNLDTLTVILTGLVKLLVDRLVGFPLRGTFGIRSLWW